jgi:hypothetical protein
VRIIAICVVVACTVDLVGIDVGSKDWMGWVVKVEWLTTRRQQQLGVEGAIYVLHEGSDWKATT